MNSQIAVSSLQVVENAVKAVRHLRSLGCTDIEFSPEDAGRSDPKFLYRVLAAVIEAGATTLNIPDTTGAPLKDLSCTTSFQAKLRMSALSMPNVLLASTIGGDMEVLVFLTTQGHNDVEKNPRTVLDMWLVSCRNRAVIRLTALAGFGNTGWS